MTIRCPTTGTSIGHPSGSLEMNPFWLGEAKTGRFYEGTSRGTNARDRRSFRRRRRSGCYNSCGRGLTTEASSRLGAARHTSAKPTLKRRYDYKRLSETLSTYFTAL